MKEFLFLNGSIPTVQVLEGPMKILWKCKAMLKRMLKRKLKMKSGRNLKKESLLYPLYHQINEIVKEEIGDHQEEIGDHQEEIGDPQEEIGDHQEEIGDPQEEIGDPQEEIGDPPQEEVAAKSARLSHCWPSVNVRGPLRNACDMDNINLNSSLIVK